MERLVYLIEILGAIKGWVVNMATIGSRIKGLEQAVKAIPCGDQCQLKDRLDCLERRCSVEAATKDDLAEFTRQVIDEIRRAAG